MYSCDETRQCQRSNECRDVQIGMRGGIDYRAIITIGVIANIIGCLKDREMKVRMVYKHSDIKRVITAQNVLLQNFLPGSNGPNGPYSSADGRDRPPLRFFIWVFQSSPPTAVLRTFMGNGMLGLMGDIT